MTKRQIQKAARIYAYAMAAQVDGGDPNVTHKNYDDVIDATIDFGIKKLKSMGVPWNKITSISDAMLWVITDDHQRKQAKLLDELGDTMRKVLNNV